MMKAEVEKLVIPKYERWRTGRDPRSTKRDRGNGKDLLCIAGGRCDNLLHHAGVSQIFGAKTNAGLLERMLHRPVLSGLVFVLLLVCVFAVGFDEHFLSQSLTILGSETGMAAGFFFGSNTPPRA
jgi:uncharacterized membrane protein